MIFFLTTVYYDFLEMPSALLSKTGDSVNTDFSPENLSCGVFDTWIKNLIFLSFEGVEPYISYFRILNFDNWLRFGIKCMEEGYKSTSLKDCVCN